MHLLAYLPETPSATNNKHTCEFWSGLKGAECYEFLFCLLSWLVRVRELHFIKLEDIVNALGRKEVICSLDILLLGTVQWKSTQVAQDILLLLSFEAMVKLSLQSSGAMLLVIKVQSLTN